MIFIYFWEASLPSHIHEPAIDIKVLEILGPQGPDVCHVVPRKSPHGALEVVDWSADRSLRHQTRLKILGLKVETFSAHPGRFLGYNPACFEAQGGSHLDPGGPIF